MLLSIEKLIYGGDGLARTPADAEGRSMAVFVPFVLPGERIDAEIRQEKPGFARATVSQIIEPSSERVAATCRYYQQCGGCQYQHISYEEQLKYKAAILRETLQRIARIDLQSDLQIHPSPPWNYRNRTRLQIVPAPEFALAYYRFGSRELLPVAECPISSPLINRMMAQLLELGGSNCPASVEEIEFFADGADERLLVWAFCNREADEKTLLAWAEALQNNIPQILGVTFFSSRRRSEEDAPADLKLLAQSGSPDISYHTQIADFRVSAGSFFQVNRHLVDQLMETVTAGVSGGTAFDLYAGVGLFSTALSRLFHHIFAVEASHLSYRDLGHNSPANVKVVRARTEDFLRSAPARKRPDVVAMDPPRAGVGKAVIRSLVDLGAPRIRYVSCDPATLARDLTYLLAAGYRIEEAHLFDLFPQTLHIESVISLAR